MLMPGQLFFVTLVQIVSKQCVIFILKNTELWNLNLCFNFFFSIQCPRTALSLLVPFFLFVLFLFCEGMGRRGRELEQGLVVKLMFLELDSTQECWVQSASCFQNQDTPHSSRFPTSTEKSEHSPPWAQSILRKLLPCSWPCSLLVIVTSSSWPWQDL